MVSSSLVVAVRGAAKSLHLSSISSSVMSLMNLHCTSNSMAAVEPLPIRTLAAIWHMHATSSFTVLSFFFQIASKSYIWTLGPTSVSRVDSKCSKNACQSFFVAASAHHSSWMLYPFLPKQMRIAGKAWNSRICQRMNQDVSCCLNTLNSLCWSGASKSYWSWFMLRVMWSILCIIQSPTLEPDASLGAILLGAPAEVVGVAAEVGIVLVAVTTVVVSMVNAVVITDSFRNDKSAKPLPPDVGTAKSDGLYSVIESLCQLVLVLGTWMPKSHCQLTLMLIGTRWGCSSVP